MNAVLSSNSSNQVPTNQHLFLLPVWFIFSSSSSSTISSSSCLQMTWEHSFPSSKCEHHFLIWCADHFQLLSGWWKSFKISQGKKTCLHFSKNPVSFQEPSSSSSSYPICDYGEPPSSSSAFFFFDDGETLFFIVFFITSQWCTTFFFIIMFFSWHEEEGSSSSLSSFLDTFPSLSSSSSFAWKWWTPKVGLFKLLLLICTWN